MLCKKFFIFVGIPLTFNLLYIALYYSGMSALQQIVAPTMPSLPKDSWREFGILEQTQNLFLLAIVFLFAYAIYLHQSLMDKLFFFFGFAFILFLLLEEIDYGLHFYEYLTNTHTGFKQRNWHNQETGGKQNVRYLKKAADIVMVIWFIVLPFFKTKIKIGFIQNLLPSRWFAATFITAVLMSNLAHYMEENQFGYIDGVLGNLAGNISEYREASNYYLYLLYAIQLFKTHPVFMRHSND